MKKTKIVKKIARFIVPILSISMVVSSISAMAAMAENSDETSQTDDVSSSILAENPIPEEIVPSQAITISSIEEFIDFAKHCSLDTFSQGMLVTLTADLDFGDKEFSPVPIFSGTFDGGNHTISGVKITKDGSTKGVFRYIQESGVVKNLTVKGTIKPTSTTDKLGAIAGDNSGYITNCNFSGVIAGDSYVGGIVGINNTKGRIDNCLTNAQIRATHYTGGIVGQNNGTIAFCENNSSVNTDAPNHDLEMPEIDIDNILSPDNTSICTDTGGIAGFSDGVITNCKNSSNVGYIHIGYNVGGIAGRQSGYINESSNYGVVNGRKDVGGITGQMEPFLILKYSEDILQKLQKEMTTLVSMLNKTLDDTKGAIDGINGNVNRIIDITSNMSDDLNIISKGSIGYVNDMTDYANITIDKVRSIINDAENVNNNLTQASNSFTNAVNLLKQTVQNTNIEASIKADDEAQGTHNWEDYQKAIDELSAQSTQITEITTKISNSIKGMSEELKKDKPNQKNIENYVKDILNDSGELVRIVGESNENVVTVIKILQPYLSSLSDDYKKSLQDAMDALSSSADSLKNASNAFDVLLKNLSGYEVTRVPSLDSSVSQATENLHNATQKMSNELKSLNNYSNGQSDVIINDIKAINNQIKKISDIAIASKNDVVDASIEDIYEDVSDEEHSNDVQGKVVSSTNFGTINGDIDVGGVTGSMAIEYDFDPEDDVKKGNNGSINFTFQTKAQLLYCINNGNVVGKKDYIGGAVGLMNLGTLDSFQGYGTVSSSAGKYVGGVVGASYSKVRNCYTMCKLEGVSYVGGIAGSAKYLYDNHSMVEINCDGECIGAIAGFEEKDSEIQNNVFVSETLAGIDGISFSEKAKPISYNDLLLTENLPTEFSSLTITFIVDGKILTSKKLGYGQSLAEFPDVPVKDGYIGEWEKLDEKVYFSQTINAVYTADSTVISSSEKANGKPLLLVEGIFKQDGAVSCAEGVTSKGENANSLLTYNIVITDSDVDLNYILHLQYPDIDEGATVWVDDGVGFNQVDYKSDGKYIVFNATSQNLKVIFIKKEVNMVLIFTIGAVSILVIVLLVVFIIKKRKARKDKPKKEKVKKEKQKKEKKSDKNKKQSTNEGKQFVDEDYDDDFIDIDEI